MFRRTTDLTTRKTMFTFSSTVCFVTLLVVLANSPVYTANPETNPLELPYTTPNGAVHVLECPAQPRRKSSPQRCGDWLRRQGTILKCVKPTGTAVSEVAWIKVIINGQRMFLYEMYELFFNKGMGKLQTYAKTPLHKIIEILYCAGNICTVYTSQPTRAARASLLAKFVFKEDADKYCSYRDSFEALCKQDSLSKNMGPAEEIQRLIKNTVGFDIHGLCVDTRMNGRMYARRSWCSDVYGSALIGNMKQSYVCEEGIKGEVEGIERCTCVNGSFQCQVYNDKQLRYKRCLQDGKQIESVTCGSCKCVRNWWMCPPCPKSCDLYSHPHANEKTCSCHECYPNTRQWMKGQSCDMPGHIKTVKEDNRCLDYICTEQGKFANDGSYAC